MKIVPIPDNPGILYLIALGNAVGSVLILFQTGTVYPEGIATVLFSLFGLAISVGLLYRIYVVWIAAIVLSAISSLLNSLAVVHLLMMAGSGASNYLYGIAVGGVPLTLNLAILYYLNSDRVRKLFGVAALQDD